ncbi:MAG: hypothetical protein JWP28_2874 [Phenylobacterium sp.]|uniref:hypothetical protein n=1 Tax=Phenylobacterium sp. TaxID=1871053 RepID=UPI00262E787C|nr:hypothetical protein [Phenylobacterium sp.]MDB5498843.1 hypothetical protein [Phenylobacterium sp.]
MSDAAPPREKKQITKLSDLVPVEWIDPTRHGGIIMDFYSSALARGSPGQELVDSARGLAASICPHPLVWHFMRFEQEQPVTSSVTYSIYSEGSRTLDLRLNKGVIPVGDYVVFVTPVRLTEEGGTADGEANHALNVARGVLTALAGHSAAQQLVLRTSPRIDKLDFMTQSAGIFENFAPPEAFAFCLPDTIATLSRKAATHAHPERQRRFATALSFVGRAAAEMDATVRFSHLWIALEVSAGGFGKVDALVKRMVQADGAVRMLKEIKEARRQLFHEGRRYALSQDEERLICAVVIATPLFWYGVTDERLSAAIGEIGRLGKSGIALGE